MLKPLARNVDIARRSKNRAGPKVPSGNPERTFLAQRFWPGAGVETARQATIARTPRSPAGFGMVSPPGLLEVDRLVLDRQREPVRLVRPGFIAQERPVLLSGDKPPVGRLGGLAR